MKTSIKVIAGLLAVLLLSSYLAYSAVYMDLKPVNGFTVTERTLTTQTISWKKAEHAAGYKIYQQNAKSNDFTLIKTIDSANTLKYQVENLDMESYYTFKISAYNTFLGFEKESNLSEPLKTCTMPRGETINEIVENTPGTLTVSWSTGLNCNGYEVEYALNEDFSDSKTITVDGINHTQCIIKNLEKQKTYNIRMRSFITIDGKKLYSEYCDSNKATVKSIADVKLNPNKPVIAFTFDDGPDFNGSSKKILDVLEKYNVRATFFTVGQNAENNPKNLQRKASLGCEIGNHTYDHSHYGSSVKSSDISKCSDAIEKIIGSRPTCFRSTGGITTSSIKNECKKEGMPLYYWSIDTEDWKTRNVKKICKAAMKAKDGDIILMHDIYPETAKAVAKLIPSLIKKGYQFVTVSELIKYKTGSAPKSGVQYISGKK